MHHNEETERNYLRINRQIPEIIIERRKRTTRTTVDDRRDQIGKSQP